MKESGKFHCIEPCQCLAGDRGSIRISEGWQTDSFAFARLIKIKLCPDYGKFVPRFLNLLSTSFPFLSPFVRNNTSLLSVPCVCVGQGMEISWKFRNPLRASPSSIHREFTGEKCSPTDEFFFLFSFSSFPRSLSFKVKVFACSTKKIIIFDHGDFFFLKKSWWRVLELMIRKIEEFKGFFFYFYGLIFHHIYKLCTYVQSFIFHLFKMNNCA